MKSRLFVLIVVAASLTAATAYAHHSFAGTYIQDKTITIEGKIVEFNIRNPHSFLNIEVKDKDGKTARWGGEWAGVTQLSEGGVTKFTFKVGEFIIINGSPSRDPEEHKLLVGTVVRPATATTPEYRSNVGAVR